MSKIIIFSGAGVSQPSGISTFRDSNGLWENHKIEEICNIGTWVNNYAKVHDFYNQRRNQLEVVRPNLAHNTIAKWQKKYGKDRVINITQNVDDLFEKAGVEDTIHVHGKLDEITCQDCKTIFKMNYKNFIIDNPNAKGTKCPNCSSNLCKPNIIFFGEMAPEYGPAKRYLNAISSHDIVLIVGTMGNVFPIEVYMRFVKHSNHQNPTWILNNMERSSMIPESYFGDNIFYESCETAIEKVDEIIKNHPNFKE